MTRLPLRPVLYSLVAVVLALSALLAGPFSAEAATAVQVNAIAMPGRTVSLVGRGFAPGSILQARWDRATTRLRLISVDSRGRFTAKIRIPASAKPGGHTVSLARVTRSQIARYGGTGSRRLIPARTILARSIQVLAVGAYGSRIGMDSLNNTQVGGSDDLSTSYRFRAATSSKLNSVRVYIVGANHAGYGAGTGGTWQVSVQTDDGSAGTDHRERSSRRPSFKPGRRLPGHQLGLTGDARRPASCTTSCSRTSTPTRAANYASVDGIFMYQPTSPRQAAFSDVDWGQPMRSGTGRLVGPLQHRADHAAELRQRGDRRASATWRSGSARDKDISGTAKAREAFTVSGPSRAVGSFSVRLMRISGQQPADRPARDRRRRPHRAGHHRRLADRGGDAGRPLRAACHLGDVHLRASADAGPGQATTSCSRPPSDTTYSIFVIRQGSSYAFKPTTYFADGHAQYTTGCGWGAFTQDDRPRRRGRPAGLLPLINRGAASPAISSDPSRGTSQRAHYALRPSSWP